MAVNARAWLQAEMKKRILVLDGPKGTLIQREGLSEADFRGGRFRDHPGKLKGDNDLLCLTKPDLVRRLHERHLAAGADIIGTNTFNGTRISQADFGLEGVAYEINLEAARIARRAADEWTARDPARPRFVNGSVGPTSKSLSVSPDVEDPGARSVDFRGLYEAYLEECRGFVDGGVDLILIETIFDTLNAKAALLAAEDAIAGCGRDVPIMVSATIVDLSGRNLSGQTVEAVYASLYRPGLLSIGLNCSLGAAQMAPFLRDLSRVSELPVSIHPNAGLPNASGGYDESPEAMAALIDGFCAEGLVNIVGGCCGSLPEHIAAIAAAAAGHPPRAPRPADPAGDTLLSGLEPLRVGKGCNFVNVGERTNVAGSKKFARLVRERDFRAAISVARDMAEGGAQVIDVCMDDALLDAPVAMAEFLRLLAGEPEIARLPLMIDSSKWGAIRAGLENSQGKSIVNSISLKEGEGPFLEKAREVARFGCAAVVMLFDEKGQAAGLERKVEIAARSWKLLTEKAGMRPSDIIFDPNVLAVATGMEEHDRYGLDFIECCRWIKANCPGAKISGGISNLSFSFRGNDRVREAMHSVFLYHAIAAGLDMGIVNPAGLAVYDELDPDLRGLCEDLILYRRKDASARLLSWAEEHSGEAAAKDAATTDKDAWRRLPLAERIAHALIKGVEDHIEADAEEAWGELGSALAVIEGPLMGGMDKVGELFGSGRMFLPQVIKSARVMKRAVARLEPRIIAEKKGGAAERTMVIATVKGDVHDIGKNIVGVVLGCNGWRVVDLGVMVPAEDIVAAAKREGALIVGLSGLITPSLEEMAEVAALMEKEGMRQPLMIGGATTSALHTALKLAPRYSGGVFHSRDASTAVSMARGLTGDGADAYKAKAAAEQETLRAKHVDAARPLLPLAEARARAPKLDWAAYDPPAPRAVGEVVALEFSIDDLLPYIDWTFLLFAWDIPGRYPEVLRDPVRGPVATKVLAEARELLDRMKWTGFVSVRAACGVWPATAFPGREELVFWKDGAREEEAARFRFLRQQDGKAGDCASLADFVAPAGGKGDYAGCFAVSCHGSYAVSDAYKAEGDDYRSMMARILADRLAEAGAEKLHELVRKEVWGYAPGEAFAPEELLKSPFRGIRPAPGYPACPAHDDKARIAELLRAGETVGMKLTSSWMMVPPASVSGFYFAHPEAGYFAVGRIGDDQLAEFAAARGVTAEEARRRIGA